jgi:uncharacterized protein (TIGR03086 family)
MTNQIDAIPFFPAVAPAACTEVTSAWALLAPVLEALADVVETSAPLEAPTPCRSYSVGELRDHVLGWLQYFAVALADPDRAGPRLEPDAYRAAQESRPLPDVVHDSAARIRTALDGGVLQRRVVMSQAQMDGAAVVAMALGEYVVHGWDLATATGRPWQPSSQACQASLEFFAGTVAPEYRSEDGAGGMFGPEVEVSPDASPLQRLLGFAGRDPRWAPPAAQA